MEGVENNEDSDDSQPPISEDESEDTSSLDEPFSEYDRRKIDISRDNETELAKDIIAPDYYRVVNEPRKIPAEEHHYAARKFDRHNLPGEEDNAMVGFFGNYYIYGLLIGFIFLACYVYGQDSIWNASDPTSSNVTWLDVSQREMTFIRREHAKFFPSQHDYFWNDLVATQKTLFADPKTPAVYLFLHREEPNTANCVAEILISLSKKFIFEKSAKAAKLNSSDLLNRGIPDYGVLLTKLKGEVSRAKILVVAELEKMPPELARVFHQLCDDINPTVRDAIYVFTLNVGRNPISQNPTEIADETLKDLWKDLHADVVRPLVTRMTTSVFLVENEPNLGICDLRLAAPVNVNDLD